MNTEAIDKAIKEVMKEQIRECKLDMIRDRIMELAKELALEYDKFCEVAGMDDNKHLSFSYIKEKGKGGASIYNNHWETKAKVDGYVMLDDIKTYEVEAKMEEK